MKRFKYILVVIVALISVQLYSQNKANSLLNGVYKKLQTAKDYSVQANIKVDMPFIRILPANVKIYFKQKDKFKVESKSIAVVPRQGFNQISKVMADTNSFTAIVQGEEKIGTVQTTIVNVIPLSDTSDVILGKFWIDPKQRVILKSQLTTRSNGTIVTEFTYGSQIAYGLPDKMIFSVDVKKFKVPKGAIANSDNSKTEKDTKGKENKQGKIFITLTNYQVNKGIDDGVFKK
jgi:outer membrane lipoprotein-sorting protein